jgi:uncharacterized Tic20 family protein
MLRRFGTCGAGHFCAGLLAIAGIPFGHIIGPLVVLLIKLVFMLFVSVTPAGPGIGEATRATQSGWIVTFIACWIAVIAIAVALSTASNGRPYRYPVVIDFVR